jgi:hypothetical protein
LQFLFLLVVLLLAESCVGVLAVVCPEYLGVTVSMAHLARSLQRTYGVPGKEQFTAAIDLAQTTVRRTLKLVAVLDNSFIVMMHRLYLDVNISHIIVQMAVS